MPATLRNPGRDRPWDSVRRDWVSYGIFDSVGWGVPGTWVSVIDAHIIEALILGTATAFRNASVAADGNPAGV